MNTQVAANASGTATQPAHTPTPWRLEAPADYAIRGADGYLIARCPYNSNPGASSERKEQTANAALIIRAVNSHAELVAALEGVSEILSQVITRGRCAKFADSTGGPMGNVISLLESINATIAKAQA